MEFVRLASIPIADEPNKADVISLRAVKVVRRVVIPSHELDCRHLQVSLGLDLEGLGGREGDVKILVVRGCAKRPIAQ